MDLTGKRALITGGNKGIGKAIAQAFVAKGAQVVITGRDTAALEATAKELSVIPITADAAIEADAIRSVATTVEELGGIDILVNNAGFGVFAPLVETDLEKFNAVFATNVAGAMLMAREATKHFIAQKSGNIINISSTAGTKGMQTGTAYSGSKFALRGMTECWRDELRRHNIRVMLINPSEVQTGFGGRAPGEMNAKKLTAKEIADAITGVLEIDDRGFIPELAVFATNPF